MNKTITLASASPRRRELLGTLGLDFEVRVPEIDEAPFPNENPRAHVERLAAEKAAAVDVNGIVIAADTIVVNNSLILGKPLDASAARRMLADLSGRAHEVITGVCVREGNVSNIFSVCTEVIFRELSEIEIAAYVVGGEPMDKAGAYAIQGGAAAFVRAINGSYTNVVGLPLCELYESLSVFSR